ncbi:MAG: hypothetical protein EBQ97_00400 [Bacteroidetes bacterium]|nr:hypothetical protein [Bacteroidota bacterium]
MGYIYKITNTITGKCYIGETIQHDKYAIQNALTKPNRKSGGFIWKYKNSDIPIISINNALKTQS